MDKTAGEYRFTRLESVIFGAGKIESLGPELTRRDAKRTLIVTGNTLGRSKLLDKVKMAAGSALAGVFSGAVQHVPSRTVAELIADARRLEADSMVSFGGGSPIDTVKAAAMALMKENGGREILHIAVPTTLSAGEFTPAGGITDEATRVKGGVADPRLQAKVVILDPALTVETPAWLWASTGMRALDHAVEGSYSIRHQMITDTLATKAIALLDAHLLPSLQTAGDEELEHRLQCQLAAWFSIFGMMNTRVGISHALGHQIGPYWNVPHGVTSCITLPHVMRFMAGVAADRFGPIADGFGVRFDRQSPRSAALECADRTAKFIKKFEVPTRLRDVGVPREEISRIADTVLEEVKRSNTVGAEVSLEQIVAILDSAY
ncbi:MAG: iron-containing alcohol dehydrogenase [Candidatus Binatus sp.]|uniref:iron-containing alcohol dehydrogenase n=1 Tax=Candidatus Binatus sp. TaxID=2811406 RepID=UPI002722ECD7|nr:iron-containing alcohol dehydrogenase [Candidatus Binatus sp.]MDO8433254.1 iron-containing alcohol dehydrogenase [Candidatus Binatus sp.]